MRTHTAKFKEEINKHGRQLDGKIYYYNNYNIVSENNDLIITQSNLEFISDDINLGTQLEITNEQISSMSFIKNGNILTSLMKEFDFESTVELRVGTLVNPHFGVLIHDEDENENEITYYEYLDYGNYIVKEKSYNMDKNTWSYVCYDKMMYFMINYTPLNVTYPITIISYLEKICEYVGLEFEYQVVNEIQWIPENSTQLIYSELFEGKGYTFRDILDKVSEVLGGNILINDEDKVTICRLAKFPLPDFERYADTFNENFLKNTNVNFDKKIGPINKVIIVDTESNLEFPGPWRNPESEEQYEIRIVDNEFAFNGNTYNIATGIHLEVTDMEYYYCDFPTTGICYLDFLDRFLVTRNNKDYPCLLLNNEITVTNGIEETIFADETSLTQNVGNTYSTPILNSKETSLIVNKQQNEITSMVSKDDVISSINQSPEAIQISANKITFEGKELNLTTENMEIFSNISDRYQYTSADATELYNIINSSTTPTPEQLDKYDLTHDGILTRDDLLWLQSKIFGYSPTSGTIRITGKDPQHIIKTTSNTEVNNNLATNIGLENIETNAITVKVLSCLQYLALIYNQVQTIYLDASAGNVKCVSVTQTSKESEKKNFEKLTNAKEILKATDIYKYNLKNENDGEKKSIGFVIGDKFNYSDEITSKNNDGANIYSMVSVLWQVVKEQQNEIDQLKEMIKNG